MFFLSFIAFRFYMLLIIAVLCPVLLLTWWRLGAVAGSLRLARAQNLQNRTAVSAVLHPPLCQTAR
jgi:hypothetical protein